MGSKAEFYANRRYEKLLLRSRLYDNNGRIMDTVDTVYDYSLFRREEVIPVLPSTRKYIYMILFAVLGIIVGLLVKKYRGESR